MGQTWKIVSPSAYESFGPWGKLVEMLFDSSPQSLVSFFAVPVPCSARNLEAKENDGKDPVRLQYGKRKREEVDSRPTEPRQKTQKLGGNDASEAQNRVTFSDLPAELHDLVFEKLGFHSIILLSLTDQYFFSLGRRHIQNFFISHSAPWAGESIICIGNHVEVGDYPPSILQDEELREALSLDEDGKQMSLQDFAYEIEEVRPSVDFSQIIAHLLHSYEGFRKEYHRVSKPLINLVVDTICLELSQFFPKEQPWILRNLTTREYVRADAIALKPEYINGPEIRHLGFGEVIFSRVCWSTKSSVARVYGDEAAIHRGIWAGHRFDITTVARHAQEIKQKQRHEIELDTEKTVDWKDISDEVVEEIDGIWEHQYGDDWREEICRRDGYKSMRRKFLPVV